MGRGPGRPPEKPAAPGKPAETELLAYLTVRQKQVLKLVSDGMSNKEIGRALYISPSTVNGHLSRIFSVLGVDGRIEAAVMWTRNTRENR